MSACDRITSPHCNEVHHDQRKVCAHDGLNWHHVVCRRDWDGWGWFENESLHRSFHCPLSQPLYNSSVTNTMDNSCRVSRSIAKYVPNDLISTYTLTQCTWQVLDLRIKLSVILLICLFLFFSFGLLVRGNRKKATKRMRYSHRKTKTALWKREREEKKKGFLQYCNLQPGAEIMSWVWLWTWSNLNSLFLSTLLKWSRKLQSAGVVWL